MTPRLPKRRQFRGDLEGDDTLARRTARATFITRLFVLVAIALLGTLLVVVVRLSADTNTTATNVERVVTGVEKQQDSNTGILKNSQDTLARVNDCTTAGQKCFEENNRRTGEVVGSLNRVTIASSSYAAACAARGLTGAEEIYRCVLREFASQEDNPLQPSQPKP